MSGSEIKVSRVQKYREKLGTHLLISAPLKPISRNLISRISEIICDIDEIREAHFPAVLSMGSNDAPECVLFLVFDQESKVSTIMESIGDDLAAIKRDVTPFEVWPICQSDSLLETIRMANCVIGWRD